MSCCLSSLHISHEDETGKTTTTPRLWSADTGNGIIAIWYTGTQCERPLAVETGFHIPRGDTLYDKKRSLKRHDFSYTPRYGLSNAYMHLAKLEMLLLPESLSKPELLKGNKVV